MIEKIIINSSILFFHSFSQYVNDAIIIMFSLPEQIVKNYK